MYPALTRMSRNQLELVRGTFEDQIKWMEQGGASLCKLCSVGEESRAGTLAEG